MAKGALPFVYTDKGDYKMDTSNLLQLCVVIIAACALIIQYKQYKDSKKEKNKDSNKKK